MDNLIRAFALIYILTATLVINSCGGGGEDPPPQTPQRTVTISGTVSDSGGLADATVSSGEVSTNTDNHGYYTLNNVPVPQSNRVVITYKKTGYGTNQKSIVVGDESTFTIAAELMQHHFNETVNPANAANLTIGDPANAAAPPLARLSLPAGSIQATENVTVSIAVGDPTTEQGRNIFPGDYMASPDAQSEPDTVLESVAFTEVTITNAAGEEVPLDSTIPADLTVKLPDEFQSGGAKFGTYDPADPSKDSVPWWSYNEENGSWIREDADPSTAEIDDAMVIDDNGVLYAQAKVTHFSWWNADEPISTHACLCVTVVDENGDPLAGAMVIAEGVSYNGVSTPQLTDANGRTCVNVKKSTATQQETVRVYVQKGGVRFPYVVTDPTEGNTETNVIDVPTTQGSTFDNSGTCVDLGNNITVAFNGTIVGRVTYEGSNQALSGLTIYSSYGDSATTDANGDYTLRAPIGVPVLLFATGLASQSVTVPDTNPFTVDFVVANRAPVIDNVVRNPSGSVLTGTSVNFSVSATDPDGDPLSYAWSANVGSLNRTDSANVIWTAPASATTGIITVIVSDGRGRQDERASTVIVNDQPTTTGLGFQFRNNPVDNQPVQGVTVALYDADNVTIAANGTRVSGADGVVNFGNVGTTATFTIVTDTPQSGRSVTTFIEAPSRNVIYYTDDDEAPVDCDPASQPTVNVSYNNVPIDANLVLGQPVGTTITIGDVTQSIVCPYGIQEDGNISILARAAVQGDFNSFLSYGYILDQALSNGANYTISLDRLPNSVGFSTTPATPISLSIAGFRSGVHYSLGWTTAAVESGNLLAATDFPADSYSVFGYQAATPSNPTFRGANKPMTTLAQNVSLPITDITFTAVAYSSAGNNFSWAKTGTSQVDYMDLNMRNLDIDGNRTISWNVIMPNTKNNWQVMQLPTPASTWINTDDLTVTFNSAELEAIDLENFNGHIDIWNSFADGVDVFAESGVWKIASRELTEFVAIIAAQVQSTATSTAAPKIPEANLTNRLKGSALGRLSRHPK